MNGFFFKFTQQNNIRLDISLLSFEDFTQSDSLADNTLYLFIDNTRSAILQTEQATYYSVGTFILGNTWGIEALKILDEHLLGGGSFEDIAYESRGQFCIVCHTAESVTIFNDKMASFPVYISSTRNDIYITNILPNLLKQRNITFNTQHLAEYLSLNYVLEGTLFNEIDTLGLATIHRFQRSGYDSSRYFDVLKDVSFSRIHSLREAAESVKNMFLYNCSFLRSTSPFVDITGGFDGRFNCTMLQHMGIPFVTGISGEQIAGECDIARQAAQILDVPFYDNLKINDAETFTKMLDIHLSIASGVPIPFHSTELFNYYTEIKKMAPIHVTGFGGSQLMFQWLKKVNILSSINTARLMERQFMFNDIFRHDVITREKFDDRLKNKLDSILERIGSRKYDTTSNYLGLFTFTKWYHACLINNHNCILPFYSPYLEANLFRLLLSIDLSLKKNHRLQRAIITQLNTPLSKIRTTHGYSANIHDKNTKLLMKNSVKNILRIAKFVSPSILKNSILMKNRYVTPKRKSMADIDRRYWIQHLQDFKLNLSEIYNAVDKNRLNGSNIMFAKLSYIEHLATEYNVSFRK